MRKSLWFHNLTASGTKQFQARDMRNLSREVITAMLINLYIRFISRMFLCCEHVCALLASRLKPAKKMLQSTLLYTFHFSHFANISRYFTKSVSILVKIEQFGMRLFVCILLANSICSTSPSSFWLFQSVFCGWKSESTVKFANFYFIILSI